MKKKVAILGSTGSIGKSLIKIIKKDKKNFQIKFLSANKNYSELLKQAKFFKVKNVILTNKKAYFKSKSKFKKNKIDGYVIPKNDEFFSEYSENDRLKIISNFSGSAGYSVILKNKNYLFVDGRYTLQANNQSG